MLWGIVVGVIMVQEPGKVILEQLHKKTSSKWRRYGSDVLPMHVAEMDFDIAPEVRAEIIQRVTQSDLGYLGPIPELGEAINFFSKKMWNWSFDPKLVSPVADVGVGAVELMRVLANPGDSVLINSPVYTNFFTWISEAKLNLVDVPLIPNSQTWALDIDGIEAAFKAGVKIYLLCNPQNPVGRVHSETELATISELSNRYGVYVISDEIHAPLTYPDHKFTPYLSLPSSAETGYVITSASKAWNIAGLKAAVIISGSTPAAQKISAMPPAVHWRTSIVGAFAMATALTNSIDWLQVTVGQLDRNRHLLKELLQSELPEVGYHIPDSSYLAWLNLGAFGENSAWHDLLLKKGKIAVVPGQDFGQPYKEFVRLNFATYPELLTLGISRIKQALS
jgi:cystathionine beta-lyase